jgi:N-acetyl-gamma-glutamyl-phosphate reductase
VTFKLFIDGAAGTTGIDIRDRMAGRNDVQFITIEESRRKDPQARADALNSADAVILCLPDDAAREAVALIGNDTTKVIDASTAHRTAAGWAYGFPELDTGNRIALETASRISNPGCYPTGFLALVRPLVRAGIIPADLAISTNATSGYSGGGKAMIASFEQFDAPDPTDTAFRIYALGLAHKHVPEMKHHAGLSHPPIFMPAVARRYSGMLVEVPLHLHLLNGGVADIRAALKEVYDGSKVVSIKNDDETALTIEQCTGTDRLELFVFANEAAGQVRLVAALDNLGKGAGGAAVQNLNIAMGLDETIGLRL